MSTGHVEIHSRGVRADSATDQKCADGCVHQPFCVVPMGSFGFLRLTLPRPVVPWTCVDTKQKLEELQNVLFAIGQFDEGNS